MIRKHADSIGHALDGIRWAFKTQPNYRVHVLATVLTLIGGVFFEISYYEWLIVLTMIIGGFSIETMNTAIEQLGDAIDKNYNEIIKRAKDLSAGAMLFYAIGSIIIACIIFIPKILILILP